jgi:glycine cleavage system H protein
MEIPGDLRFSKDHEWVRVDGNHATVGISEYAQDSLGDIVFVQLPHVGDAVAGGEMCGEVESTKTVSELYSPVAGTVTAVNDALADAPDSVNVDPYGAGWMFVVELEDAHAVAALMDADAYRAFLDGLQH